MLDLDNGFERLKSPIILEEVKIAEHKYLLCIKGIPCQREVYMIIDLYDFLISITIGNQEAAVMFINYKKICK